ncbi:MAG TPA: AAA family ATPase [Terriglobia bacterium]|nr:AAA family ATPase [Terriglobia bacterium]
MFDYIKIEGFRSFKTVELNLEPLSVLIGPNGGGKSNLLDLMSLMGEAGNGLLEAGIASRGGPKSITFGFDWFRTIAVNFHFRKKEDVLYSLAAPPLPGEFLQDVTYKLALNFHPTMTVSLEEVVEEPASRGQQPRLIVRRDADGCTFYRPRLGFSGLPRAKHKDLEDAKTIESRAELAISQVKDSRLYPIPYELLRQFQQWTAYRDIDVGPRAPIRLPALVRPSVRLAPDGSNLTAVLNSIQQRHQDIWDEVVELIRTAYPEFKGIKFPPEGGDGNVALRWLEKPFQGEGVTANLLSDGTLKLLCLIAILKSPDPPPLICIDEPEVGLHPDWIELVAELMQSAATRTQLIVATHSPQIVAKLDPEQVIVTEKEEGETHLERLNGQELEKWLDEFNLSDLWLAGHIGGRP